jgi:hypothetical protein
MSNCIYGVDVTKEITAVMVRDAIIQCFLKAHSKILEEMKEYDEFKSKEEFERMKLFDVKLLIQKYFEDTDGDFENPTKDSILKVIKKLQEFAVHFRKPEIVKEHTNEIMTLINKLS